MRGVRGLLLLLVTCVTTSHAGDINLRWDHCRGDGGTMNANFACDTNAGSHRLVGSFIPNTNLVDIVGLDIVVDLGGAGDAMPAWWQFKNAGACRISSLGIALAQLDDPTSCIDWADGQAVGGITSYTDLFTGSVRMRITSVIPASFGDLSTGQEYFAFLLTINHLKTVGTGSCAGCGLGACIALKGITLTNSSGYTYFLGPGRGSIGSDDRLVTWQGGTGVVTRVNPDALTCLRATPARNSTWGEVKSLYR